MKSPCDVAVLVGSLRRDSFTRKIANVLVEMAPAPLRMTHVDLSHLTLYNEDDEAQPPVSWQAFRDRMTRADAVLFVTPEYNRSVPAVLKNAIDVGSRPLVKNIWNGKPGAVVGVSPGKLGAFGAVHHLRQSLVFVNVPAMVQPEAYIGGVADLLTVEGTLKSESTREFLRKYLQAFVTWIDTNSPRGKLEVGS